MKSNLSKLIRILFFVVCTTTFAGCISSGKKTEFYTLFPSEKIEPVYTNSAKPLGISLGVGPVSVPEYATKRNIVSFTKGNVIRIAGYHAWAGSIETNIVRVMSSNIATALGSDNVQTFPWDTRARPEQQLSLNIIEFGGVRGESVQVKIRWAFIDNNDRRVIKNGEVLNTQPLNDDSIVSYISGLNLAVNQISQVLAEEALLHFN